MNSPILLSRNSKAQSVNSPITSKRLNGLSSDPADICTVNAGREGCRHPRSSWDTVLRNRNRIQCARHWLGDHHKMKRISRVSDLKVVPSEPLSKILEFEATLFESCGAVWIEIIGDTEGSIDIVDEDFIRWLNDNVPPYVGGKYGYMDDVIISGVIECKFGYKLSFIYSALIKREEEGDHTYRVG